MQICVKFNVKYDVFNAPIYRTKGLWNVKDYKDMPRYAHI